MRFFRTLEEAEYYREYSEALIRKMEDKMLQLEEANRTLEREMVERKRMEDAFRESEKNIFISTGRDSERTHKRASVMHRKN